MTLSKDVIYALLFNKDIISMSIAIGRLTEERKNWRKDHPVLNIDLSKFEISI